MVFFRLLALLFCATGLAYAITSVRPTNVNGTSSKGAKNINKAKRVPPKHIVQETLLLESTLIRSISPSRTRLRIFSHVKK
jgi:hypothetical protein